MATEFSRFIDQLSSIGRLIKEDQYEDPLVAAVDVFHAGVRGNFQRAVDQDGVLWPPRKAPTGSWPLLIKTGRLYDSATSVYNSEAFTEVHDQFIDIGSSVPYGIFHMAGTSRMPPRPFFYARDEVLDEIGEIVAAYLEATYA